MGNRTAVVLSTFGILIGLVIAGLLGALVVTLSTPESSVVYSPTAVPAEPEEFSTPVPMPSATAIVDGIYSTEPLTFAERSYMSRVLNYLQVSQGGFSLMAESNVYGSSVIIEGANSVISAYRTMEIATPPPRFEVFHRKMLDAHASCPVAAELVAESVNIGYTPRSTSVKLAECARGMDEFTAYLNDVIEWLKAYL